MAQSDQQPTAPSSISPQRNHKRHYRQDEKNDIARVALKFQEQKCFARSNPVRLQFNQGQKEKPEACQETADNRYSISDRTIPFRCDKNMP